ncbi:MAG: DnaA regulatory inactivator Hda [Pseudomonadota bacterium]
MPNKHVQLPLGIRLRDDASFENFHAGANQEVVGGLAACLDRSGPGYLYLWGGAGCGKTHLLSALCHAAADAGLPLMYLPLSEHATFAPEILHGMETLRLVCLDDIEAIAGLPQWEEALFHFYNRLQAAGGCLVITGETAPAGLDIRLPDLKSRLCAGIIYHLKPLDDADKLAALRQRAAQRGMEMPLEVGAYLLRRCPRDMNALFALLDRLDHASLAAQRRLTVPFVREVLSDQGSP